MKAEPSEHLWWQVTPREHLAEMIQYIKHNGATLPLTIPWRWTLGTDMLAVFGLGLVNIVAVLYLSMSSWLHLRLSSHDFTNQPAHFSLCGLLVRSPNFEVGHGIWQWRSLGFGYGFTRPSHTPCYLVSRSFRRFCLVYSASQVYSLMVEDVLLLLISLQYAGVNQIKSF